MTDNTQPEAGSTHIIRYALELGLLWIDGDGRDKVREALDALDTLEAQLKALKPNGEAQQLTPLQAQVAAHYQGGEFGYIETQDDAQNVGDGLFTFCINEAGDAGDKSELVKMLNRAIEQLRSLVSELEAIGAGGVSGPLMGIAAPPTAQTEGWRPIETAPKDKSNIVLLRQPCGSIANGFWLAEAYAGNGAWIWPYVHKTPTHWMPLPPPPTSAEGVEHG